MYQPTPPMVTTFPSTLDLRNLRQRLKDSKFDWNVLTNAERWRYHAYDYAFLRFRREPKDSGYALDPHCKWFNESMVQAAERLYARPPPPPRTWIPRADVEPDPNLAAHFRRQDDQRIPLKRQVQVHGERQSDGSYTPELQAFMHYCLRQTEANEKIFKDRTRYTFRPEARMTPQEIHELHKTLGVSATERKVPKHEDPEEFRKAAIELGLLQEAD
jgi:hypothetical protein